MASNTVNALINSAEAEWAHWGKATWNCITKAKSKGFHIDDETAFAQYIIDTYLPPFYKKPVKWPTTSVIGNDDYAWSAVTISHFMISAGLKRKGLLKSTASEAEWVAWVASSIKDEFPIAEAHSEYIRWAIRGRQDGIANAAYWGYRVDENEATPDIGDLIGYPRAPKLTAKKALNFFDRKSNYTSHTDLVVAKRPGEIDVIGGNVRDSVTKKTLAISPTGHLADTEHFWFVVLKCRL